jgi:hypothetical protein
MVSIVALWVGLIAWRHGGKIFYDHGAVVEKNLTAMGAILGAPAGVVQRQGHFGAGGGRAMA